MKNQNTWQICIRRIILNWLAVWLKLKFMWNKSKYIQITKYFKVVAKLAFKRLLQVKVKVWIEVSIFVKFQLKLWRWSEVKATKWEMVWFLYATWTKQYLKKYSRKYLKKYLKKYLRSGFYMQHGQRNHFTMNLSFSSSSVDGQCTDSKVFNNPPLNKSINSLRQIPRMTWIPHCKSNAVTKIER